ncbi:MAG TPA: hypothetical protein DEQ34_04820 [Balneolaceae bacterium]|nr:hypothetical protein [Balneolaceae bacterium]|tara:strand:+ start:266320 stop:266820 length:501 start_codon:yes stop_codon:yes gene_type:complete
MKAITPILLFLFIFFVSFSSCNNKKEVKPETAEISAPVYDLVKAEQLVKTSCYACHAPNTPEESRLAPIFEAIKRRYNMDYPTREQFVNAMADFVANPTTDKAIMYSAVDRFGLMTPLPFPEEDLKAIATYIYQNEMEKPEWFEEHFNNDMQQMNRQRRRMGQQNN